MTLYRSTYDGDRDIVGLLNELLGYVSPYFREKWDLEAQVAAVVPVEPDYEADAEAIYSYLEATNMQGASFFPWANIAKRRWINAYKAALDGKAKPDVRAWHTIFMQALHNGADKNTAYDAVLDAALGVGEETP